MTDPMSQSEARRLARQLSASTGLVHIAAAVPLGCWGGTEAGWDVFGPSAPLVSTYRAAITEDIVRGDK